MDNTIIILVCSITACIFSVIALVLGILALIKVIAMEKSTHSIQYMPMEEWATPENEIEEINKEFKEELIEPLGL
jgi:hypothetical protein